MYHVFSHHAYAYFWTRYPFSYRYPLSFLATLDTDVPQVELQVQFTPIRLEVPGMNDPLDPTDQQACVYAMVAEYS